MFKLIKTVCLFICLTLSITAFANRGRGGHGPQTRPGGSRSHGSRPSHGNGHVERPVRFRLGPTPRNGWRGNPYYWEGHTYSVWGWQPYAPFYTWPYYYGWTPGLYFYIPEGMKCFADNTQIPGEWVGRDAYYYSDDAIDSALGYCENDPNVMNTNTQGSCRIRNCVRW